MKPSHFYAIGLGIMIGFLIHCLMVGNGFGFCVDFIIASWNVFMLVIAIQNEG